MANPTYNTTPVPFDPPESAKPVFDGLTSAERTRLVKIHQQGGQTWSASGDPALQSAGLVLKLSSTAYISPFGCQVAVWAHYQGVTP